MRAGDKRNWEEYPMKKAISMLTAASLVLALAGCGATATASSAASSEAAPSEAAASSEEAQGDLPV